MPEKIVTVQKGMSVSYLKNNGTTLQRQFAKLFDVDNNNVYDETEAMYFNSYSFEKRGNSVLLKDKIRNNEINIAFDNESEYNSFLENGRLDYHMFLSYMKDGKTNGVYLNSPENTKIRLNTRNSKISIFGGESYEIASFYGTNLTIENHITEDITEGVNSKITKINVKYNNSKMTDLYQRFINLWK